ncbi:DUF1016 family protein [Chryseobacterium cucumeris]|uniref:DUF1016 family protein n=1 Tax=Chryseobacterium cucumeris TaxID=1813611 RepID=A0ABX9XBH6_9FLAO|nr:DUF1016 family protein [Chryseobacterium cucumeris]
MFENFLRQIRLFGVFFSSFPIWNAVRTELSWTHYRIISRIDNPDHRIQYVNHAIEGNLLELIKFSMIQ